ncbi:hypothetical protein B4100_2145 [Heyndrickxia coagulans]|nr:hypothetical protein B4100_2145 [Heyndrickxia coagulans]
MDSGQLSRICDIFHICEQNIKKAASHAYRFDSFPSLSIRKPLTQGPLPF